MADGNVAPVISLDAARRRRPPVRATRFPAEHGAGIVRLSDEEMDDELRAAAIERGQMACEFFGRVGGHHLLGGVNVADDEVGPKRGDELGDRRQVVHDREIDGLYLLPERKTSIGDDESIGVADAREQVEDRRIQDSGAKHGEGGAYEGGTSKM